VRRIIPPLYKFADEPLEGVFQTMAAAGQRRLLTLGLVLNALATALEWRMGGMSDLLTGHFALAWGVCACILLLPLVMSVRRIRPSLIPRSSLAVGDAHAQALHLL
jgi:hypothetical protein